MKTGPQADTARTASPPATWTVQPHGELQTLDDGLWVVSGTIHVPIGRFPRRMTVARLEGGGLLIYSAIAIDDATLQELEGLGTPTVLVVPNHLHREDAPAWKQRYPGIRVIAPVGSRERVASAVPVDTTATDLDDAEVSLVLVPGTRDHEVALLIRRAAGTTLVLNDVAANIRGEHGFNGWLLRLMGFAGNHAQVPGPVKLLMIRDKAALADQLLTWAALADLRRIVVSHGDIIDRDPQGVLRSLAESLS